MNYYKKQTKLDNIIIDKILKKNNIENEYKIIKEKSIEEIMTSGEYINTPIKNKEIHKKFSYDENENIADFIKDFYSRYGHTKSDPNKGYRTNAGSSNTGRQRTERTQRAQRPQPPLPTIKTVPEAYKALELDPKANYKEAKKQFWKLAKTYHPDKNPTGIERFKQIANAWDILEKHYKGKK